MVDRILGGIERHIRNVLWQDGHRVFGRRIAEEQDATDGLLPITRSHHVDRPSGRTYDVEAYGETFRRNAIETGSEGPLGHCHHGIGVYVDHTGLGGRVLVDGHAMPEVSRLLVEGDESGRPDARPDRIHTPQLVAHLVWVVQVTEPRPDPVVFGRSQLFVDSVIEAGNHCPLKAFVRIRKRIGTTLPVEELVHMKDPEVRAVDALLVHTPDEGVIFVAGTRGKDPRGGETGRVVLGDLVGHHAYVINRRNQIRFVGLKLLEGHHDALLLGNAQNRTKGISATSERLLPRQIAQPAAAVYENAITAHVSSQRPGQCCPIRWR